MTDARLKVQTLKDWFRRNPPSAWMWERDTVRNNDELPDCSKAHIKRTQFCADRLPESLQILLSRKDYQIIAIRAVSDFKTEWKSKTPRGYSEGRTYDHAGAVVIPSQRLILIGEYEKRTDTFERIQYLDRMQYVFEHEIGHAIDNCLEITKLSQFHAAYCHDVSRLPQGMDSLLKYFLQKGKAGPEETFAEIYSSTCGILTISAEQFEHYFAQTTALIKERLELAGIPLPENREQSPAQAAICSANAFLIELSGGIMGAFNKKGKDE